MGVLGSGGAVVITPSDRQVMFVRDFAASRRQVFEAWTSPTHLQRWMTGPDGWRMLQCERDLRDGGHHRSVWRHDDGSEMEAQGVFQEVRAPQRLVFSEAWSGGWPQTLNTVTLVEGQGRTTVTMTILYPSREARDAALQSGMKDGIEHSFAQLEDYLRTMP